MNKLFIFEPCYKWQYCGGVIMTIAKDLFQATEFIHQHLKDEKIQQEKVFMETWYVSKGDIKAEEHKQNHIKKFQDSLELSLNAFIKDNDIEGIGEKFKTKSCEHYWELFDELPTKAETFGNGKKVYVNYNYA